MATASSGDSSALSAPSFSADQTQVLLKEILDRLRRLEEVVKGAKKDYFTVEEFAKQVRRAPYTVRAWAKAGIIQARKVGDGGPRGRWTIPSGELERIVEMGKGGQVATLAVQRP